MAKPKNRNIIITQNVKNLSLETLKSRAFFVVAYHQFAFDESSLEDRATPFANLRLATRGSGYDMSTKA